MNSVNLWHDIEKGEMSPDVVRVIVETPKGSKNVYAYDKKYNLIGLKNTIDIEFPGEYGFIPQTYFENGNPLGTIVFSSEKTYPGILLRARPVALLRIVEENLYVDKIISVMLHDKEYSKIKDISSIQEYIKKEIERFFNVYKRLEGKTVKAFEWKDASTAKKVISHTINLYERKFS